MMGNIQIGDRVWCDDPIKGAVLVLVAGRMGGDVDLAFPDGPCRYGVIKELYPMLETLLEGRGG